MWQREGQRLDMVAWDWLAQEWISAPDIVSTMLFGDDEAQEVSRAQAEEIASQLGIPPVPSEEKAMAIVDAADELLDQSL